MHMWMCFHEFAWNPSQSSPEARKHSKSASAASSLESSFWTQQSKVPSLISKLETHKDTLKKE